MAQVIEKCKTAGCNNFRFAGEKEWENVNKIVLEFFNIRFKDERFTLDLTHLCSDCEKKLADTLRK